MKLYYPHDQILLYAYETLSGTIPVTQNPDLILFGVRAPLVVDYEMVAQRSERPIAYGVSVDGTPRVMFGTKVVDLAYIEGEIVGVVLPCAFGPVRRHELAKLAMELNLTLAETLIDPSAILPPRLRLGAGGFINAGVILGAGCMIGSGVLLNRSASIGHHCVLEDWVSVGPGAIISGNVRVGAYTMIGAGAILQSDIRVGTNVRIAAGSVVRKSVPDGAIVSGNPGKIVPGRPVPSTLKQKGAE